MVRRVMKVSIVMSLTLEEVLLYLDCIAADPFLDRIEKVSNV